MRKFLSILVWLILSSAIIFSGYKLEKKINEYRTEYDKKISVSMEIRKGRSVDFDKLKERNKDVIGWIWLKGTQIDYPIVRCDDNDYYIHRDLDGNYLFEGTLFTDALNEEPFNDPNTIIYGHFMYSGSMFGSLNKYQDETYFKDNKTIVLETPNGSYDIHVIAFCNEPADSALYTTHFYDDFTREDLIDLIKEKAVVLSDEQIEPEDKFVVLSTCAYNYEDARHQLIGVIRPAGTETIITETEVPAPNKWLYAEIGIGALMALVIISSGISVFRKERG